MLFNELRDRMFQGEGNAHELFSGLCVDTVRVSMLAAMIATHVNWM